MNAIANEINNIPLLFNELDYVIIVENHLI